MKKLLGICLLAVLALAGCEQPTESASMPPPGAPGNVQLIAAERQLTVTWEEAAGAASYELYYGSAADTEEGATRPNAHGESVTRYGTTTAVVTSLSNGVTYYVWVKALNEAGETWSEPASGTPQIAITPPETPKNVHASGLDGQLLVSWDAAEGAVSYEIYMGTEDDPAGAEKVSENGGLKVVVGGLENDVEYTVWMAAKNSAGPSGFSEPVKGTPVAAPVFTDIAALVAYLKGLPENTATTPYAVALSGFDLSNGDLSLSNNLLGKIYLSAGTKYLSLDLNACTGNLGTAASTSSLLAGNDRLVSCVLPEDLTIIGYNAFRNSTSLTSVTLPKSLARIGYYAFYGCTSLESITLPENLEIINWDAFSHCASLESITLPESLTSIDARVFSGCTSLKSVRLPVSLASIGSNAFSGCTSLASISLPEGLETIGTYAFSGCSSLASVSLLGGLETIGNYAFQNCSSLASISLPGSLTNMGTYTFSGCTSLVSVGLPGSLTSIGNYAFRNCTALASITLPGGLTGIGTYAFSGCIYLASVSLPDSLETIENYAFQNCTALASITLPGSLQTVGGNAFQNCSSLSFTVTTDGIFSTPDGKTLLKTEGEIVTMVALPSAKGNVTVPATVTEIAAYTFAGYSDITGIILPEDLKSIGSYAFQNCSFLESVGLPGSLTSIGSYAFQNCSSLESIELPGSLTSIGTYAFSGCSILASVTIQAETPPTVYANSFTNTAASLKFYVPAGKVDTYKGAAVWSATYASKIFEISS
jgi:hypothetical protein